MIPNTSNATSLAAPAGLRDGRFCPKDESQLLRQCPNCMQMNTPAHSLCQCCGLEFFKAAPNQEETLHDIYVGIGSGAFMLACLIVTALRFF